MAFVSDLIRQAEQEGRVIISFEFFTPRNETAERRFYEETLPRLLEHEPDFCSVTYGAGGSTRSGTLTMVSRLQDEYGVPTVAHLTCIGSTRDSIISWLSEAKRRRISNVLALRGDPPQGVGSYQAPAGGFRYAVELVRLIREMDGFCIGVAGFPEGHPECAGGKEQNWLHLKEKIDAGADFVITQLFFVNEFYTSFVSYMRERLGVTVPIIPGIIPILSAQQIERFVELCRATIPDHLRDCLERVKDDHEAAQKLGIDYAVAQCADLLKSGVRQFHFYTLNRADSISAVLDRLGLATRSQRRLYYSTG